MTNLYGAVFSAYPNVVIVRGDDIDSLEAIDANETPVTLDKSVVKAKLAELQAAETAKQEAEIAAKESALSKLTALGLTADEVKALLGVK